MPKCPKPDVAFYLPVYDTDPTLAKDSAIAFRDRHWERLPSTAMAEPFTWSTLHMLSTQAGLRPCPRMMSGGYKKTKAAARLRCYPWLIAEFKKAHHDRRDAARADEIVCCQASNGAACALQLNKELAQFARPLTNAAHVPPIPVVTTTGSKITVWIAYYAKDVKSSDRFAYSRYKASYEKAYVSSCSIGRGSLPFRLMRHTGYASYLERGYYHLERHICIPTRVGKHICMGHTRLQASSRVIY